MAANRSMALGIGTAALLLAAGLGWGIWGGSGIASAQDGEKAKAEEGASAQPRAIAGVLRASRIQELKAKITRYAGGAAIVEVADQGAWVSVGDTVAVLKLGDFDAERTRAELDYRTAELGMIAAEVELKNRQEEASARLARIEFDHAKAKFDLDYWNEYGHADELKRAEMGLQGHVDGIADQEEELRQLEELYAGNEMASESQKIVLERARRRLQRAKESYEIAKHGHEYTIKHALPRTDWERNEAFKRADALLARSKADEESAIGLKEAGAIKARMALEAATKRLAELASDSDNDTIYAPFSGILLHGPLKDNTGTGKPLEFGDPVTNGQTVATLLDVETLDVSVWVPLHRLQAYRDAQTLLAVATDAGILATAPAYIAAVSPVVVDGKVNVRISVDNADKLFMHGQAVRIEIGG